MTDDILCCEGKKKNVCVYVCVCVCARVCAGNMLFDTDEIVRHGFNYFEMNFFFY